MWHFQTRLSDLKPDRWIPTGTLTEPFFVLTCPHEDWTHWFKAWQVLTKHWLSVFFFRGNDSSLTQPSTSLISFLGHMSDFFVLVQLFLFSKPPQKSTDLWVEDFLHPHAVGIVAFFFFLFWKEWITVGTSIRSELKSVPRSSSNRFTNTHDVLTDRRNLFPRASCSYHRKRAALPFIVSTNLTRCILHRLERNVHCGVCGFANVFFLQEQLWSRLRPQIHRPSGRFTDKQKQIQTVKCETLTHDFNHRKSWSQHFIP